MHKARNSDLMQPVQLTFLAETPDVKSRDTFFFFFLGYRGIVHPPSADEGTERTWFEPDFFFGLQGRCPLYAGCEAHKDTRQTYAV
jgi:hypothetical protein